MQASKSKVAGQSPETQGGAAKSDTRWASALSQVCGEAICHLEEYLASQGHVQSDEQEPSVLRHQGLGHEAVPGSAAQALQTDLEALADILVRMRMSAIYAFRFDLIYFLLATAIALLIWLVTPIHRQESSSILSTILWTPSFVIGLDSLWILYLLGLVSRCRVITASLQKKLAEGSLEPRDKSKLRGAFLWSTVGTLHRIEHQREGPQPGAVGTVEGYSTFVN